MGDWREGSGFAWLALCLALICTDSLSLTQTCILEADSLRLLQIHPVSIRFTQIHSVSFRLKQSHSDPPNLTQITDSLRSVRFHSDSFRVMQAHTDLHRFIQFRSDSRRFAKCHSVSFRFIQNPSYLSSYPFRSLQSHPKSPRLTQSCTRFLLLPTDSQIGSDLLSITRAGQS